MAFRKTRHKIEEQIVCGQCHTVAWVPGTVIVTMWSADPCTEESEDRDPPVLRLPIGWSARDPEYKWTRYDCGDCRLKEQEKC